MAEDDPHYANEYPENYSELLEKAESFEIGTMIVCAISFLCSSSVLLTAFMFPSMVKNKIYMHMILMVSLNDACLSVVGAMGYPPYNSGRCATQGALVLYFMRGSWIWCVFILFQLDGIVYTGRLKLSRTFMQVTAFIINFTMQMIPLAFGQSYGSAKYFSRISVCEYVFSYDTLYPVTLATTFMGPMLLSLSLMLFLFGKMLMGLRSRRLQVEQNRALVRSVSLYPLCQLLVWLPFVCLVFTIFNEAPPKALKISTYQTFQSLETWVFSGGIWMALVFFCNSSEARQRWRYLLSKSLAGVMQGLGVTNTNNPPGGNANNNNSNNTDIKTALALQDSLGRGSTGGNSQEIYTGESDFLIDDEMVEHIAVTEREEFIISQSTVAGGDSYHHSLPRPSVASVGSLVFSARSSTYSLSSSRPSGLSERERSLDHGSSRSSSIIEMSSRDSSNNSNSNNAGDSAGDGAAGAAAGDTGQMELGSIREYSHEADRKSEMNIEKEKDDVIPDAQHCQVEEQVYG